MFHTNSSSQGPTKANANEKADSVTNIDLFVVRDATDGSIVYVTNRPDEAEAECGALIGTNGGTAAAPRPTKPVLERYEVQITEPIGEPVEGAAIRRKNAARTRRLRQRLQRVLVATSTD